MNDGTILLMRHAEKSDDPLDPNLSPAGLARADRLATYIPDTFGRPDILFAAANSKHSHRPHQTLKPLAERLGLPINMEFADQDYGALAHTIHHTPQYEGLRIVICWHHGNIPSLADALGAEPGAYPNPWPASVFNLILQFRFVGGAIQAQSVTEPF